MIIISPSILAADFSSLGDEIRKIERAGAQYVHIDVMDGVFVPNISFGMPFISSLRKCSDIVFDVHLMITEPQRYIKDFIDAGADIITIHYESCDDPAAVIKEIKALGCRAAVSIKPATPASVLFPLLDKLDMVLVMTVEPGFGGQSYIEYCTDKVRKLRSIITARGLDVDVQVDGGIAQDNTARVAEAGANVFVAGSSVFKGDVEANVKAIMAQFPG